MVAFEVPYIYHHGGICFQNPLALALQLFEAWISREKLQKKNPIAMQPSMVKLHRFPIFQPKVSIVLQNLKLSDTFYRDKLWCHQFSSHVDNIQSIKFAFESTGLIKKHTDGLKRAQEQPYQVTNTIEYNCNMTDISICSK